MARIEIDSQSIFKRPSRTITQRGKQYKVKASWCYRIRYKENGVPKSIERSGFVSKAAASKEEQAAAEKLQYRGGSVEIERKDFNWLADECEADFLRPVKFRESRSKGRVEERSGYRSWSSVKSFLTRLRAFFGPVLIEDITKATIQDYRESRIQDHVTDKDGRKLRPVSFATVHRELALLRRMLTFAVNQRYIAENPFSRFTKHDHVIKPNSEEVRDRIVSETEEARLIAACTAPFEREYTRRRGDKTHTVKAVYESNHVMLKALVTVALDTGLRLNELRNIKWNDIDARRNTVVIRSGFTKSGKERETIILDEGLHALEEIRPFSPADGPFTAIGDIKKAWTTVRTNAGLEDLRFHDLRRTFASRMAAAGVSLSAISTLLGHSIAGVTSKHYIRLDETMRAEVIEKVKAYRRRYDAPVIAGDAIAFSSAVN